ncbi:hypothetical protein K466DRAFT_521908 [Polyporus arcularius HHB13444]|uniref:Protein kinase domain-containing protein n=1 Tax=Polyporus arcularius HHB13444 TaxID=1314778 RepID=A0A5C3PDX4_9APHY|nr:hypothetical protein K466DRAFT_521908 [Polyporus arcularius HHB13444]
MLRFLASRAHSLQSTSLSSQGVNYTPSTAPSNALPRAVSDGSSGSPPPSDDEDDETPSEVSLHSSGKSHAARPHAPPPSGSSPQPPAPISSHEDDSDDEEEVVRDDECPMELQSRFVYVPPPAWQWAAHHSLSHVRLLNPLSVTPMCKTNLMRGLMGYHPVTFIERRWTRAMHPSQTGLFKELKLFSSDAYLRELQGIVVPNLINVYDDIHSVSLLFEPPHPSFWMTASKDMPWILKKRVVDAYLKLHEHGILHGSPELHNIFIGADCRVSLFDFSKAGVRGGIPALGLANSRSRSHTNWELREVMYKLDFEGARVRETAKFRRAEIQKERDYARDQMKYMKSQRVVDDDEEIGPDEMPNQDDREEPAPPRTLWKSWEESVENAPPSFRIIVPGQSSEQLAAAEQEFKARVKELEEEWKRVSATPLFAHTPEFPLPVPIAQPYFDVEESSFAPVKESRKRKVSPDAVNAQPPAKRHRREQGSSVPSPAAGPVFEYSSSTYSTGTSETLLRAPSTRTSRAASKQRAGTPPVKSRDFASEPYDGPRGYYVPHPPTEYIMTANRTAHILNCNALEYGRLGIPFFRGDIPNVHPPLYRRSNEKATSGSLGVQKRKIADMVNQHDWIEDRDAKRQRYEEERRASLKEKGRPIRISDTISYAEAPRYHRGNDTRTSPYLSEPLHNILQVGRGILKKTPPVKLVSYDLMKWLSNAGPAPGAVRLSSLPPPIEDDSPLSRLEQLGQRAEGSVDGTAEARRPTDTGRADANERDVARAGQVPCEPTDAATGMVPGAGGAPRPVRYTSVGPGGTNKTRVGLVDAYSPDELDEREVEVLLDPRHEEPPKPAVQTESDEILLCGPAYDKTMLDNVCQWLGMREPPDCTDLWEEGIAVRSW